MVRDEREIEDLKGKLILTKLPNYDPHRHSIGYWDCKVKKEDLFKRIEELELREHCLNNILQHLGDMSYAELYHLFMTIIELKKRERV